MRLLLLALVSAVALLATAPAAWACSCLRPGKPRVELARADGAFVGVFLGRRRLGEAGPLIGSGDPFVYRFRVERRLKGRIGRTIEVVSARDGASCGLEVVRGQRVGLLLRRLNGRWHSSLCEQRRPSFFRGVPSRQFASCG